MGAVSTSEDILDRLIEDVRTVQSELIASGDPKHDAEAHLKRCEALCEHMLRRLDYAKSIAADPSLSNPLRIAVLEIEKDKITRNHVAAKKEIERLKSKIDERRLESEKTIEMHQSMLSFAENKIRTLRTDLKAKEEAIRHFARTHRTPKPVRKKASKRHKGAKLR